MKILLVFLVMFSASRISTEFPRRFFVVWNVGQGQWTTWIQDDECWHFDWGGEFFPVAKAQTVCGERLNRILLSHWDWDHVGGLQRSRIFPRICLARAPIGRSSVRKEKLLPQELCSSLSQPILEWKPAAPKIRRGKVDTNSASQVFSNGFFLVEGDSPQSAEREWSALEGFHSARLLVLGHHGSRTSTSEELLQRLPFLKQAVSSARWERYKHPHAETLARLKRKKIPVLRTQDWGSLWFEL